ncbi:hypothetical protein OIU78_015516 [Salix suchowensis]|nr:hypothetical protein OIU78_015516 [Salix suchowensis]
MVMVQEEEEEGEGGGKAMIRSFFRASSAGIFTVEQPGVSVWHDIVSLHGKKYMRDRSKIGWSLLGESDYLSLGKSKVAMPIDHGSFICKKSNSITPRFSVLQSFGGTHCALKFSFAVMMKLRRGGKTRVIDARYSSLAKA